jgi:hypothetical protein
VNNGSDAINELRIHRRDGSILDDIRSCFTLSTTNPIWPDSDRNFTAVLGSWLLSLCNIWNYPLHLSEIHIFSRILGIKTLTIYTRLIFQLWWLWRLLTAMWPNVVWYNLPNSSCVCLQGVLFNNDDGSSTVFRNMQSYQTTVMSSDNIHHIRNIEYTCPKDGMPTDYVHTPSTVQTLQLNILHTPWTESVSELYRQNDRRLSAKLVPTFADREYHVFSVTDP